jgi:hypothetical protein
MVMTPILDGPRQVRMKCNRILAELRVCMSDSSAQRRPVIDVIIPHSSVPRVLLLAEDDHWSLPRVPIGDTWAVDMGQIRHELLRTLGIATTVLRLASKEGDDAQRQVVHNLCARKPCRITTSYRFGPSSEGRYP